MMSKSTQTPPDGSNPQVTDEQLVFQAFDSVCGKDIAFTQFLRPDGRRRLINIGVPTDVASLYEQCVFAGAVFEIEVLRTGQVHMDVVWNDESIAGAVCSNDAAVEANVSATVRAAYEVIKSK